MGRVCRTKREHWAPLETPMIPRRFKAVAVRLPPCSRAKIGVIHAQADRFGTRAGSGCCVTALLTRPSAPIPPAPSGGPVGPGSVCAFFVSLLAAFCRGWQSAPCWSRYMSERPEAPGRLIRARFHEAKGEWRRLM